MTTPQQQIDQAILGLQAQRGVLGDAVVDTTIALLQAQRAALDSPAASAPAVILPEQVLKQVTVLFLDVVGSTTLARQLDPEDVHAVMDGALASCTQIVQAHQGRVLQYAGDNLLAVFGADAAQEDDAQRAVCAGLALLEEGRRLGEQVLQRHGQSGFDVRVGVHTGGVLLGGGVDGEGTIRGIAVNIAARMEQTAPAGALRISRDTYAHVRGLFDVQRQPPIEVKGVQAPIVTYLVTGVRPRAFRQVTRGIEGVQTRMVGRDAELTRLQDTLLACAAAGGRLACLTVVAEAGVGKSRLLYEFLDEVLSRAERINLFQGRAHPGTLQQAYGLLRDVLAWRLQIGDHDTLSQVRQKLEEGLVPLLAASEGTPQAQAHTHLLGHLVGVDFSDSPHVRSVVSDARQMRHRAFHAAALVLRCVARQSGQPLLLVLEDLHWADEGSLDFIGYLMQEAQDLPLLVLGLTRPALFDRRPEWPAASGQTDPVVAQRMELQPLGSRASRQLADELLQRLPEVPAALRDLVTGTAEGNPYFMEELVRMLVTEGAIGTADPEWTLHSQRLGTLQVPQTLTGVLQARLDAVPAAERRALQQASVIGFVFWDQALAAIDDRSLQNLPGVTQRSLVVPHAGNDLEGVREYAFHHQLLHQVTYDTVLKRARREYHAKAGAWLAGLSSARANDFLGAAADHFEKAGIDDRASEFHTRAAEHARARFAHEIALEHVSRALALMGAASANEAPAQARLRWRLLDVREATLGLQARRDAQRLDLAALDDLAEWLDDDHLRFEANWKRIELALRTADYPEMAHRARRGIELARGDANMRLRAQQRLSIAVGELGDVPAAVALSRQALPKARALGLRRVEALLLNVLSVMLARQGDVLGALALEQQKLVLDRELGSLLNVAINLGNLALSWVTLGDFVQGRAYLQESLQLSRVVGDRGGQLNQLLSLAHLDLRQDQPDQALAQAQAALEIAGVLQSPEAHARALCACGHALFGLGRSAEAAAAFDQAHSVAVAGHSAYQLDAAAGRARVAHAQRDRAAALAAVDEVLQILADAGGLDGSDTPQLVQLICHDVLAEAADPRAAQVLERAHAELARVAADIADAALSQSFLDAFPERREIQRRWSGKTGSARA